MFDLDELVCDHTNIIEAIRKRDCNMAKLHLSEHLDHVMCDQQILLEGYPNYFIKRKLEPLSLKPFFVVK